MKKNKIIITLSIVIIAIIAIIIIILNYNKKNEESKIVDETKYYLELKGNTDIVLYVGDNYNEYGYSAYDSKGNTYGDNDVEITHNVNTDLADKYTITYKFKDIEVKRNVTVITPKSRKTILGLNGESIIFIKVGEKYNEPGYYAIDSKYSNEEMHNKVQVSEYPDTTKPGTYRITYTLTNDDNITLTKERIVIVTSAEFSINYTPKEPTNKDIKIYGYVTNNYYDYILLPDGSKTNDRNFSYTVNNNDIYTFKLYLKDGTSNEETINITNIDKEKPTGTCNATINTNTEIKVNAKDNNNISKYIYTIDNTKYESNKNTYKTTGLHRDINVTIYDEADNNETIKCTVEDNSWPDFVTPTYLPETTPKHFLQNMVFNKRVKYLLYYPDNLDLKKKNPLVVYIHGAYECGTNTNKMIRKNGIFVNNMKTGKFKDAVYLAPQCNCQDGDLYVCEADFRKLIDQIVNEYNINPNRISLTGISSGGSSAQRLISKNPELFSGAALLAPYITTGNANNYKNQKIAVFIGTLDNLHNPGKTNSEILRQHGVDIKFYSVQNVGHVLESSVYDGTNVIEWLIAQEKK